MAQEKIETVMRGFAGALAQKDVEKALSFFGEEAAWESPQGLLTIGTDGEPTPKFRLLAQVQGGKLVPVEVPK